MHHHNHRNSLLLIGALLGVVYVIYSFGGLIGATATRTAVGFLTGVFRTPHVMLTLLAVIVNIAAYFSDSFAAAAITGALYVLAGLFSFSYIPFVIIQAILAFVAAAQMRRTHSIS